MNLEKLYLSASTTESKKTVNLTTLSGLETLRKLKNIELKYYKLDLEDAKKRLSSNPALRLFKVNNINIPLTKRDIVKTVLIKRKCSDVAAGFND